MLGRWDVGWQSSNGGGGNNGGGGGSELYVYAQKNEPEGKDGIWINTEATGELPEIDKFTPSGIEIIGDNAFTPISNIPYAFYYGTAAVSGTDIYLFFGKNDNKNAYRYNTIDDTYTQLKSVNSNRCGSSAVAIDTDIYIFGGASNTDTYRYNTLNDTYTQLANAPFRLSFGSAAPEGTNIYLFGNLGNNNYTYRYNTLNDTYTQLANAPFNPYLSTAISEGTNIYFLGCSNNNDYKLSYKYNTLNDTYTQLVDLPYNFYGGKAIKLGTNILSFGGAGGHNNMYMYNAINYPHTRISNFIGGARMKTSVINNNVWIVYYGGQGKTNIVAYDILNHRQVTYNVNIQQNLSQAATASVGNNIYIFMNSSGYGTTSYKYCTLNNTISAVKTFPSIASSHCAVAIDESVYLFGCGNYYNYAYKFNTLNNGYTRLEDLQCNFRLGTAVSIGTNIYLFGGEGDRRNIYMYNTLNKSYTKFSKMPFDFYYGTAVALGTDIYLFRTCYGIDAYKYNTLNDTYTQLVDLPYNFYGGEAFTYGTNIYISKGSICYIYNAMNYPYIIGTIPYVYYLGNIATIGTDIYLLGGIYSQQKAYKTYTKKDSTIYIFAEQSNGKIKISPNFNIPKPYFANIAQNNSLLNYPCYYGDGNSWQLLNE